MTPCTATRSDGRPCCAPALTGEAKCFWHSATTRQAMLQAASRGGSRSAIVLPEADELTPSRARRILAGLVIATAEGAVDADTARAVAYLISIDLQVLEKLEIDKRLAALEAAAALNKQEGTKQ